MKALIKVLMIITILIFLLSGCFSAVESEYDEYYYPENEIIIIEHTNPVVIVAPTETIVEQPKRKRRTGGKIHRGSGRRRVNSSYRYRNNHRNFSLRNGNTSENNRRKVEKRIRNRK